MPTCSPSLRRCLRTSVQVSPPAAATGLLQRNRWVFKVGFLTSAASQIRQRLHARRPLRKEKIPPGRITKILRDRLDDEEDPGYGLAHSTKDSGEHVNKVEERVQSSPRHWRDMREVKDAGAANSVLTPLGDIAHHLHWCDERRKTPVRTGYVSLASWPRKPVQHKESPGLSSSPEPELPLPVDQLRSLQKSAHVKQLASQDYSEYLERSPLMAHQVSSVENPTLKVQPPPKLDELNSSWSTRFHGMSSGRGLNLTVIDLHSLGSIIQQYAPLNRPVRKSRDAWEHFAPSASYSPLKMWEDVMLWCLYNAPKRAFKLLLATINSKNIRPPRYMVGDCLEYLAKAYLGRRAPDRWILRTVYQLTCNYVWREKASQNEMYLHPTMLSTYSYNVAKNAQARSLLEVCIANNVSLHANTLLHFVDKSIQWGTVSLSMKVMKAIVASGFDLSKAQVQSACVKLLRTRFNIYDEYGIQTKIVTQLLEMGIVPGSPYTM